MHKANLILVIVTLALCLPFLRLMTVPPSWSGLPNIIVPHR